MGEFFAESLISAPQAFEQVDGGEHEERAESGNQEGHAEAQGFGRDVCAEQFVQSIDVPTGGGVGDDADGPGNESPTGVSGCGEEGEEGSPCEREAGGGEGDRAGPEHADEEAGAGAGGEGEPGVRRE